MHVKLSVIKETVYLNSFSSQYEQFSSSSAFAQSLILSHLFVMFKSLQNPKLNAKHLYIEFLLKEQGNGCMGVLELTAMMMVYTFDHYIGIHFLNIVRRVLCLCILFHRVNLDRCHNRILLLTFRMRPQHQHMTHELLNKSILIQTIIKQKNFTQKFTPFENYVNLLLRNMYVFIPLQIRLHGNNGPIRSGRHSGSNIEQINSCDRFEHFDSIKYWK